VNQKKTPKRDGGKKKCGKNDIRERENATVSGGVGREIANQVFKGSIRNAERNVTD